MSTQVQRRKGTTAQHATFTGASAELTVDTTKNTVVVHDGATAGGIPLAKETGSAISVTSLTSSGASVISVTDNTNAALRITQLGTGDALLVEDSANPDSSPTVIDASGNLIVGYTSRVSSTSLIEAHSAASVSGAPAIATYSWDAANAGGMLALYKSQSDVVGTRALVSSGATSDLRFYFDDGVTFQRGASINGAVDGTPALNSMPGRLTFATTPSGSTNSVERMRINSAGDIGIGTTAPVVKLEIAGTNSQTWIVTASISGVTMDVTAVSSGTIAVGDLVFGANIQPYTRVTALGTGTGGVGTYTVSVSQTAASASVLGGANYGATLVRITDTDTSQNPGQPTGALQFYTSDSSSPTAGVGAYVAALSESLSPDTSLVFGTRDNAGGGVDANERMRLDSSGNLGIGTNTPAAKLAVVGTAAISGAVTLSGGTANGVTYLNGSKVLTSGTALTFDGTSLTLPSFLLVASSQSYFGDNGVIGGGAADGNTTIRYFGGKYLAFKEGSSEQMRLTSTGLGIGTSSPFSIGAGWTGLTLNNATNGGTLYLQQAGVNKARFVNSSDAVYIGAQAAAGYLVFESGGGTERMRLDSSGNLGIGTTSPAYKVDVSGSVRISSKLLLDTGAAALPSLTFSGWVDTGIYNPTGTSLGFSTSGAERMRLDSSGNLLVGQTATGLQNGTGTAIQAATTIFNHVNGQASGTSYAIFGYNATSIGSITQSGTTAVLYNVTSDQRLKENIVDAPEFGSVIDSIKVRSYDWKTDQTHQRAGFIAQELVTVAPEAVHQPADPEDMMAVDYSKLVPMLVKELQSLRARVASLESK